MPTVLSVTNPHKIFYILFLNILTLPACSEQTQGTVKVAVRTSALIPTKQANISHIIIMLLTDTHIEADYG